MMWTSDIAIEVMEEVVKDSNRTFEALRVPPDVRFMTPGRTV